MHACMCLQGSGVLAAGRLPVNANMDRQRKALHYTTQLWHLQQHGLISSLALLQGALAWCCALHSVLSDCVQQVGQDKTRGDICSDQPGLTDV